MRGLSENKVGKVNNKELYYLLKGRIGGRTTIKIIDLILEMPLNRNQIANLLKIDYKTVTYHLKIVSKYDYVTVDQFENKYFYRPGEKLLKNIDEYYLIKKLVEK